MATKELKSDAEYIADLERENRELRVNLEAMGGHVKAWDEWKIKNWDASNKMTFAEADLTRELNSLRPKVQAAGRSR